MTIGAGGAITVAIRRARPSCDELLLKARAPLEAVGLALHGRADGAALDAPRAGAGAAARPRTAAPV